jgi:hypothetical protein
MSPHGAGEKIEIYSLPPLATWVTYQPSAQAGAQYAEALSSCQRIGSVAAFSILSHRVDGLSDAMEESGRRETPSTPNTLRSRKSQTCSPSRIGFKKFVSTQ